jgi:hypothetical protein
MIVPMGRPTKRTDESSTDESSWDTSPLADYPVGPDDAGNAVMHGLAFVQRCWRWLIAKVTRRADGTG